MAADSRKIFSLILITVLLTCSATLAQQATNLNEERARIQADKVDKNPQYFPSTFNSFERQWYHAQLAACQEPSLYENRLNGDTVYRFLWIPSFHHTICARLTVKDDGTATLELKQLSGYGGYRPGQTASSQTTSVAKGQVDQVLGLIKKMGFWQRSDGEMNKLTGTDGSEWVLEGVANGKYRVVEMWSPSRGPLVDLGRLMVEKICKLEGKDVLSY